MTRSQLVDYIALSESPDVTKIGDNILRRQPT